MIGESLLFIVLVLAYMHTFNKSMHSKKKGIRDESRYPFFVDSLALNA
ncbi:hypothetical protein D052_0114 [Vibrio parahaemolyticus 10290]|nr:hypothetical protein D052_0114 [Vibrio parahaemolyticus 10290]